MKSHRYFWILLTAVLVGLPLYALPATLSLPRGRRPGLPPLTLAEAADQLRASGKTGWELVEAARALVGERMAYCRRNSFDCYPRAFARGYGYCVQHAEALYDLLARLGFQSEMVHALRCRFPHGKVASHAWVQVTLADETRPVDPIFYWATSREISFVPLSPIAPLSPLIRLLSYWASPAVNAHRFYRTGKDFDG
jgi:transglutaminase-like putative cysteine protease